MTDERKMTYFELHETFCNWNKGLNAEQQRKNDITGVIVFDNCSFEKEYEYPLESRSYTVSSYNKAFISGMISNSIFGDCLDGSESGIRLDIYINSGWKVEYCYLTESSIERLGEKND